MSYRVRWSGPVPVRVGAPPPVTPIQAAEEGGFAFILPLAAWF